MRLILLLLTTTAISAAKLPPDGPQLAKLRAQKIDELTRKMMDSNLHDGHKARIPESMQKAPVAVMMWFSQSWPGVDRAVEELLALKFSVNAAKPVVDYTPLMIAVERAPGFVERFLKLGAQDTINAKDLGGHTVLDQIDGYLERNPTDANQKIRKKLIAAGAKHAKDLK